MLYKSHKLCTDMPLSSFFFFSSTLSVMDSVWCLRVTTWEPLLVFIRAMTGSKCQQLIIKMHKKTIRNALRVFGNAQIQRMQQIAPPNGSGSSSSDLRNLQLLSWKLVPDNSLPDLWWSSVIIIWSSSLTNCCNTWFSACYPTACWIEYFSHQEIRSKVSEKFFGFVSYRSCIAVALLPSHSFTLMALTCSLLQEYSIECVQLLKYEPI